jgi:hypothetical protein
MKAVICWFAGAQVLPPAVLGLHGCAPTQRSVESLAQIAARRAEIKPNEGGDLLVCRRVRGGPTSRGTRTGARMCRAVPRCSEARLANIPVHREMKAVAAVLVASLMAMASARLRQSYLPQYTDVQDCPGAPKCGAVLASIDSVPAYSNGADQCTGAWGGWVGGGFVVKLLLRGGGEGVGSKRGRKWPCAGNCCDGNAPTGCQFQCVELAQRYFYSTARFGGRRSIGVFQAP